ncbi:protein kinase domain containing protein [Plasmodium cynomolgi strain B]|uniref:Protein kinase domain containing protein n=1 Tax=Plasmodium cynomolgi (strain B) TaxID=1120755 RepID=K6UK43_PLACD|nr:protein kinase domain containing protein [Plasmodium cynomolgi strain B]GAB66488.1 protein kinase domain containing protein [Plasmodium cynomolgi strain B]
MNKKFSPIKETNIEKGAIDIFKQKIERKKQNYLRFSFTKSYQNRKGEENRNDEENDSAVFPNDSAVCPNIDAVFPNNNSVCPNNDAVCPNNDAVCPNDNSVCAKNKKVIIIQTCDTYDKYILNLHDEESEIGEKDTHAEEEKKEEKEEEKKEEKGEEKKQKKEQKKEEETKYNSLHKKTQHKGAHKKGDNIYIPLKILSNKYHYSDIVQATNNFAEENKIAKGGNGVVYKGMLKSCISVAIKVLHKNENNGFENEVIIMSRYRHKNILSLLGYAVNPNYFYLIYEYVHLGDLRTLLFNHYYFYSVRDRENAEAHVACNVKKQGNPEFSSSKKKISPYGNNHLLMNKQGDHRNGMNNLRFSLLAHEYLESTQRMPLFLSFNVRLNILIQIINVLCYLHTSSPIVYHRDLKSANILIDEKFNAKLGDFGLSFVYKNNNNVFNLTGGTPGYADPYYISTHEINEQTEIYSFGALILEMLVSKSPAVHVGKNYNCIYNTNDKCPIFCHRKKSENEDNVFDYLVNHINMNDYKSIYAVLDHSVHFPEFLVEKLTKLSFLCLNPNIKNRPSSKLVNLILLEIQKESEFYIKQQNELVQKKISCTSVRLDDYQKGEECAKVGMQSDGAHMKEGKSGNADGNGKVHTSEKKEKGKNTQQEGNEPNRESYANRKEEINYDNVKEMFFKFMCAVFGGGQVDHLDQGRNSITNDEDVDKKLRADLSIEFYTNLFKAFLDACADRSRNTQVTNDQERNEQEHIHSSPFKYNTVGNLTQMKNFFFDKLHKDVFFKNHVFNSFSLNLMNCYFARFIRDYLQNCGSARGLESLAVGKVAAGKGSLIGGTTEDPQGSATNQFQLGSCANQKRFGRALNECPFGSVSSECPFGKAASPCNANESSQQSRAPNCGLRRVGADEDVHIPSNIKGPVQVTPLRAQPIEGDGSGKGCENRSGSGNGSRNASENGNRNGSRNGNGGGKLPDALLSEGQNCRMRNKNANEDSTFLKQGGEPPGKAQNKKHDCYPPACIDLMKNSYRAGDPFQRNSDDPGGDHAQRNKPPMAMHRNNGKNKCNLVNNANAVSRSSHQNQGSPDSMYPNQQNITDYEKGNNCRDANNLVIGRNSQGLCKNDTFGQTQQSGQNAIANFEDMMSLYSSPVLQNEKKPQQNTGANKWPLKRNCGENPPKVDLSIAQEQQQQLPGQKEQGINDKKMMRMNVAVEEGKGSGSFGARRGGPRRGCGLSSGMVGGVSSGRGYHRGSNRDSLRDDGGTPQRRGPRENNVVHISNFANYLNFDRNKSGVDSNAFEWFHKNVFELVIEENKVISEVTFLDILYEFNIFTFKKNSILSNYATLYGFPLGGDTTQSPSPGKYSLSGKWSNYANVENNFITDNLANEFFFEIAVHHDIVKKTHTVFLLKSNRSNHHMCNDSEIVLKKTWVSDYVGRRNDFVEKILKKSISNMLYECISRKHCLFLLQVQMKKLRRPTIYSDVSGTRREEGFSYYLFEYNLRVVCNSDNCIFSNNYILYKNNIYSYTLPCNTLSLLVFSENQIMKGGGSPGKHSPLTRQVVHFPLYPFFVNINIYSER